MQKSTEKRCETSVASIVAPEDLRCGDYISLLNETREYPSHAWLFQNDCDSRHEPVRITFRSSEAGLPLQVKAMCLPFLFVQSPDRQPRTLDVRQVQLVRLNREYARLVTKHLRKTRADPATQLILDSFSQ